MSTSTFSKIKNRVKSDRAAALSTEMIMLIAVSVFAVIVIFNKIMIPFATTSGKIGDTIITMGG